VASSGVDIRFPRLSLLGKFALVSLITIVLLGLVLAKTLQIQIRNQALTTLGNWLRPSLDSTSSRS
jgi:hypothetical protein